jgi:hypothetical protein
MMSNKNTNRVKWIWKALIIALFIVLGIKPYAYSSVKTTHKEVAPVIARVNGQPIYESQVNHGIASNTFDSTANDMKQNKLNRLISQTIIGQFLKKHSIKVGKDLVDKEVASLEKNPPNKGCACCTYPDLSSFLNANAMTMDDLRNDIQNSIGLTNYARIIWKKSHPNNSDVMKAIGEDSNYIRKHYVKGWQIFFNTFQQSGNQQQIDEAAAQNAQKAWKRLQNGESFEKVAKSVSEDMTSKHKGGYLGFIDGSTYGREFQQAISSLKPGAISKPIHSSFGYHIIKCESMTDGNIVKFCESYFIDQERNKLISQIVKAAKIEMLN